MAKSKSKGWLRYPLVPRNGNTLEILVVGRVSDPGPGKQDERSNADQELLCRGFLEANTELPFNVTPLLGQGSGECLEREEYLQLTDLVASGRFDVVLCEDLGRIVRRVHAHIFCEDCVDHKVRLIALNDHVDTAEPGWQDRSIFSAWHHERSNRDTSDRIKRTHRSRFLQGGVFACHVYGYRKKPGAKSDDDVEKLTDAEPIYKEWFERLDRGALYAEIADWLNEIGVPLGPHCRKEKWDGPIVSRVTHNWMLKGLRYRNKRRSKRHNASGKYVTEPADPEELLTRQVPHLAFFEPGYYDRVVAKADARNARYKRNGDGGPDPCANRPKKRVRFPGQIMDCGTCGRQLVFGGHGQADHLVCSGAADYKCWNAITVDGPLATQRISEVVFREIETVVDFDPAFLEMVNEEAKNRDCERQRLLREAHGKIAGTDREIDSLMRFIKGGDDSPRVREELRRLEQLLVQLRYDKQEIEAQPSEQLVIPSPEDLKAVARDAFQELAADSVEFGRLLRAVTGRITVLPFRAIDGGAIVLRAKFTLRLTNLLPDKRLRDALAQPMAKELIVDISKLPQRVENRQTIVELREEMTEREAAKAVGITHTAAQRAAKLDRLMKQQGVTDPYALLTQPPTDYSKLRRHLHRRYHFEPLPGYPIPW